MRHKRRTRIFQLKTVEGELIDDPDLMKQHTIQYFKNIYAANNGIHTPYEVWNQFPKKKEADLVKLREDVTDSEIREAVFEMSPFKAPGVNGLHAGFFQTQWSVIGKSVCEFVKGVFTEKNSPRNINSTLIVLIPKK